jgi:hypothetical protein
VERVSLWDSSCGLSIVLWGTFTRMSAELSAKLLFWNSTGSKGSEKQNGKETISKAVHKHCCSQRFDSHCSFLTLETLIPFCSSLASVRLHGCYPLSWSVLLDTWLAYLKPDPYPHSSRPCQVPHSQCWWAATTIATTKQQAVLYTTLRLPPQPLVSMGKLGVRFPVKKDMVIYRYNGSDVTASAFHGYRRSVVNIMFCFLSPITN